MSAPISIAKKILVSESIKQAIFVIGGLVKNKQEHKNYIEEKSQDHLNHTEKEDQNHRHHTEKTDQEHCNYIEKQQQSNNNEIIKSALYTNSYLIKKSFESSTKREEEDRRKITECMDRTIQEIEKRNDDNMKFMSQLYFQREEFFNQIIDAAEQVSYEIQYSSEGAEDAFYESESIKLKKAKIKNYYGELEKLYKKAEVSIIRLQYDIDSIERSLIKSDGAYEQIIDQSPAIRDGLLTDSFFKYADFVLKKHLLKIKKEIELIEIIEDKDRIEGNLKNAKEILDELEYCEQNNLYKLIANVTSVRKLSGVMHMGKKINQRNEADGIIDGAIAGPLLEHIES